MGDGISLYPNPAVPMSLLSLNVNGLDLSFMITARPYHPQQNSGSGLNHTFNGFFDKPIEELRGNLSFHNYEDSPGLLYPDPAGIKLKSDEKGPVLIPYHCLPHIRGIFVEARGTHLFYQRVNNRPLDLGDNIEFGFCDQIQKILNEQGLDYVRADDFWPYFGRSYPDATEEALKKQIVTRKNNVGPDFEYGAISMPEFIEDWQNEESLVVQFPLRLEGFTETLPLFISNRTHAASGIRRPVVLGIEGSIYNGNRSRLFSILRIKDGAIAQKISDRLTSELGIPIDTVLCTPQPGRPKYERVAAQNSTF